MENEHCQNVVIVDQYYNAAVSSGFPIFACPGLHDLILNKIIKILKKPANVLELGAGSGLLSSKLSKAGYQVTAVDIVNRNFRAGDTVQFICADLNSNFQEALTDVCYDLIVAVELIEHLENPRNLIRNCRNILKQNGVLLVTTPNIQNPISKAMFLKDELFQWFTDSDYKKEGHIMPISSWLLKKMAEESGLRIEYLETYGSSFRFTKKLYKIVFAKFLQFVFCKKGMSGEVLIAMMQK